MEDAVFYKVVVNDGNAFTIGYFDSIMDAIEAMKQFTDKTFNTKTTIKKVDSNVYEAENVISKETGTSLAFIVYPCIIGSVFTNSHIMDTMMCYYQLKNSKTYNG